MHTPDHQSKLKKVVVAGGRGGIGAAFVERLAARADVEAVQATWHRNSPPTHRNPKVSWHRLDLSDEAAVCNWAKGVGDVDWLINAAGMLHTEAQGPEKTVRHVDPDFFIDNMTVNALPTLLLAKHLRVKFRHGRPAVFATVSARVGSIQDNHLGGWFSYRASKAALNMCIRTLAIEWRRSLPNVAVTALHPGTTDTALSRPFQKNVPAAQLFTPDYSVACMLEVLDGLHPSGSGQFLAFDGEALPW